jgi:adenylate kinase family enzyme
VDYYRRRGLLVAISGTGPVDKVHDDLVKATEGAR